MYYASDFMAKFCEITSKELKTLSLVNIHTEENLNCLMSYLKSDLRGSNLQELHIEGCPLREECL